MKERVTHPYPLHLQEDGSLEGLLPRGQVAGQLHPEGVALSVAHQDAEAQGVVVLLLGRVLQAQVEPRLQPAVLCHPQLQIKETKQQHELKLHAVKWLLKSFHFYSLERSRI